MSRFIWGFVDQSNHYFDLITHDSESGSRLFQASILGVGRITAYMGSVRVADLDVNHMRGPAALYTRVTGVFGAASSNGTRIDYTDPQLGWSLSETSRKSMGIRLDDPDIKSALMCVTDLIRLGQRAKAPSCAD